MSAKIKPAKIKKEIMEAIEDERINWCPRCSLFSLYRETGTCIECGYESHLEDIDDEGPARLICFEPFSSCRCIAEDLFDDYCDGLDDEDEANPRMPDGEPF